MEIDAVSKYLFGVHAGPIFLGPGDPVLSNVSVLGELTDSKKPQGL